MTAPKTGITAQNIFEKGMLIAVHSGYYEGRKKLSKEQLKDLPQEIVRGVHDLFDTEFKKLVKEIGHFNGETRGMIKRQAIPFPIDGIYFLSSARIDEIVEMIEERDKERSLLIGEAVKVYDEAIETFASKYPDFYNNAKGKYLTKADFAERFYFSYQFIKISPPDKDSLISPEQYKKEMAKFKSTIDDMKKEVVSTIYQSLLEMTARLKKQMINDKPNQRTFNNLNKFLEQVDAVYADFVDRDDLKKMIEKVKADILGITADTLRDSEDAKAKFQAAIAATTKELKALPDIPLKRAIDL